MKSRNGVRELAGEMELICCFFHSLFNSVVCLEKGSCFVIFFPTIALSEKVSIKYS